MWRVAVGIVLWVWLPQICVAAGGGSATSGVYFVRSPQPIVAPPGDRVVFECETNVPAERVVWLHNQSVLDRYPAIVDTNNASIPRKGSKEEAATFQHHESGKPVNHLALRISRNPHRYRQQAGDYQCVAWFGAIALTSLPGRLSIATLGEFPPLNQVSSDWTTSVTSLGRGSGPGRPSPATRARQQENEKMETYTIQLYTGETAVLPCPPPSSDPPATVVFYKDGSPLLESARVRLLPSGNCHVINVSQSDAGEYTCTAANHITAEVVDSQRLLRLVVLSSQPGQSAKAPRFLWKPEERYLAQIGHNVTLECAATGWPRPRIRWTRQGGGALPTNGNGRFHLLGGGALVISGLVEQDEGGYVCELENGIGSPLRATTLLQLTEPVNLVRIPQDSRVEEGSRVTFNCAANGRPPPQIYWVFNGNSLTNDSHVSVYENQLVISNVTKKHAGIFQCFASNSLSRVEGSGATLQVLPRPQFSVPDDEEDVDVDEDDEDFLQLTTISTLARSTEGKIKHNGSSEPHRGKGKKGKHRLREMIPPSRPNITRLTDESVMVRWSVPPNEGLPIEFFKVQYKEAGRWKTIDEDIPAHIRSYEVTGLQATQTYRFRIAAVYSNNDNKLGPNSKKFVLEKDPPKRKPSHGPLIELAEPVSQSAIMIHWKYPDFDSTPLEGFFIYYRSTASAGDYEKVTVLGSNTRSHIVTHLLPETYYDLKMQAFNMQGTSEFSRIVTAKTYAIPQSSTGSAATNRHHGNSHSHRKEGSATQLDNLDVVSSDSGTSDTLYVVLGAVLGGMTVLVVLLVALYHCRQRVAAARGSTVWNEDPNLNVNGKANGDASIPGYRRPYHAQQGSEQLHKMLNGHSYLNNERNEVADKTAETSFCEPDQGSLYRNLNNRHSAHTRNNGDPLPLLLQNNRRDPCLSDDDWATSVPAADSEKFI